MIFIGKNSKGRNSVKNIDGAAVFFLCTLFDDGLYICTKFHENILGGIKVLQRDIIP